MGCRSESLARRLEQGVLALDAFADLLTDSEWVTQVPGDGRKIGVIVHHVASTYPIDIQVAQLLAQGKPITGITPAVVAEIKALHAREQDGVTQVEALEVLRRNSGAAAAAIRALSDAELDQVALVSYYFDAPVSCQFWIEDRCVRHSHWHLGAIRAALAQSDSRTVGRSDNGTS